MKKAEIHLMFMAAILPSVIVDMERNSSETDEECASRIADDAVEVYLSRWPDLKLED